MQKRHCKQVNDLNHASAYLMDYKAAEGEKRTKLEPSKWKPYAIADTKSSGIDPSIIDRLLRLRDDRQLPPKMLTDLYRWEIIQPPQ